MKLLALAVNEWHADRPAFMRAVEKDLAEVIGERHTGCLYLFVARSDDEGLPEEFINGN